jgi:hypothetical protein
VEWFNTYSANAREVVSSVIDNEEEDTGNVSDVDIDKTNKRLSEALSKALKASFAEVSVNPWDIQPSNV